MATIQELARKLYRAIAQSERADGSTYYHLSNTAPEPQWMQDVIRAAHGTTGPDDTIYEFVHRAAGHLADQDATADYDELRDAVSEMEPDVYTHDLTAWLARRVDHVYYLSEVLENFGPFTDGFQLLMAAQAEHIQEVANALLDALQAIADAADSDEEDDEDFSDLPTIEQVEARLREENCLIVPLMLGWIVLDAATNRIYQYSMLDRDRAMNTAYQMRYAKLS